MDRADALRLEQPLVAGTAHSSSSGRGNIAELTLVDRGDGHERATVVTDRDRSGEVRHRALWAGRAASAG